MFRLKLLIFTILASIAQINAQELKTSAWFPEIRLISGFVADHSNSMAFAIKKPVKSLQINMLRTSSELKFWHSLYGFPITGFGYYYADLGNPEVLGYTHSIYGVVDFPLIRKNAFSLNFNANIGLAYYTRYFDAKNNIYNSAMGSHINSYFDFSVDWQQHIFKKMWIGTSFGLTHSSNGRTNTPNLGINLLTCRLAIRKASYQTLQNIEIEPTAVYKQPIWSFNAAFSGAIRERGYPGGEKFFVHSIMLNANKTIGEKSGVNVGFDFFHDQSIVLLLREDSTIPNTYFNKTHSGVHLGYNLLFDSFWVVIQQGFKIHNNEPTSEFLYQRVGINYQLKKHLLINFSLKTYFAKAEFIELGIGYRLDILQKKNDLDY